MENITMCFWLGHAAMWKEKQLKRQYYLFKIPPASELRWHTNYKTCKGETVDRKFNTTYVYICATIIKSGPIPEKELRDWQNQKLRGKWKRIGEGERLADCRWAKEQEDKKKNKSVIFTNWRGHREMGGVSDGENRSWERRKEQRES